MAVIRSNNPSDWTLVDRISIAEVEAPGAITDTGSYVAFLVGRFERGPVDEIVRVTSAQHFKDVFGGYGVDFDGYQAVVNKKWSGLHVVRVSNDSMAASTKTLQATGAYGLEDSIVLTANSVGAWGDQLKVAVLAASDTSLVSGFAVRVRFYDADGDLADEELFDNIADIDSLPEDGESLYVNFAASVGATLSPDVISDQDLAGGSEGSFVDTDYVGSISDHRGLFVLRSRKELAIVVCGKASAVINAGVKATVDAMQNAVGIISGLTDMSVTNAIADVPTYRLDRVVYCFPYVKTYIDGALTTVLANSFVAAALTRLAAHLDIAGGSKADSFAEVIGLSKVLEESDYEVLNKAGILAMEQDDLFGHFVRNGVNTNLDVAKLMIFRRRMTDKLTKDIAQRLEFWRGKINSEKNRLAIKGEMDAYLEQKVLFEEIEDYSVDVEKLNTVTSLANGELHIELLVKLFSSLRYIVLHATVGERVVVSE